MPCQLFLVVQVVLNILLADSSPRIVIVHEIFLVKVAPICEFSRWWKSPNLHVSPSNGNTQDVNGDKLWHSHLWPQIRFFNNNSWHYQQMVSIATARLLANEWTFLGGQTSDSWTYRMPQAPAPGGIALVQSMKSGENKSRHKTGSGPFIADWWSSKQVWPGFCRNRDFRFSCIFRGRGESDPWYFPQSS